MDIKSKLKGVKVLVVGDVMLDRFWWGDVSRISPEAPVPVVRLKNTTLAAGGAANVAANISGLGAEPILLGCVGDDAEADELKKVMEDFGIDSSNLINLPQRNTTVKTRVIAHSQQVARVDQETAAEISAEIQNKVFDTFIDLIKDVEAIAVSDYAKGFLPEALTLRLIQASAERRVPVIVDPKGRDYSRYKNATLLTPNRREAAESCNLDDIGKPVVDDAGNRLLNELELQAVLITEGEDGMTLFERNSEPFHLTASAREVYDVTGAGDTVLAAIAASLAAGFDLRRSAEIANVAAGLVVEKVGTSIVSIDAVQAALPESSPQTA
jgi:D-beta-D-heptose 7-phosphate kinase/D-beta-D-heptose 1-phosphate adenosyltransferase